MEEIQRDKVKALIAMYGPSHQDNPYLDAFIDDASSQVSAEYFGTSYEKAVAFLTLHNICLSKQMDANGGEGVITSKSMGPVSVSYARFSAGTKGGVNPYSLTTYGVMYMDLCRSCGITMNVTGRSGL